MNVVQQSQGIDNFFKAMFGFFRRKTDLFTQYDNSKTMIQKHLDESYAVWREEKEREEAIRKKKEE